MASQMCLFLPPALLILSAINSNAMYTGGVKGTFPMIDYDCTGKVDGNYPHPTKCTHFVQCVAQMHAYEMACALNFDGKPFFYVVNSGPSPQTSRCDYPEKSGCRINSTTSTPQNPTQVPTQPSTSASTPVPTPASTTAPTQPSTPTPTQPSIPASTPVPTQPSTTAPTQPSTPTPTQPSIPASTPVPTQPSTPASTTAPTQPSTPTPTQPSIPASTPAPTQPSTPAPTQPSTPAPTQPSSPAPTQPSTPASASAATSVSTPAPTPVSTTASTPVSTSKPTQAPVETSTQTTEATTPGRNTYIPPILPIDGDSCTPQCRMVGYCRSYFTCNESTHLWQSRFCGDDLFWNENAVNGVDYGGSCDFFPSLESSIQKAYQSDENCISKCTWWQEDGEICTENYHYRTPFDKTTTSTQTRDLMLKCPQSPEGVQLIWDQKSLSCKWCEEVSNSKNEPCIC